MVKQVQFLAGGTSICLECSQQRQEEEERKYINIRYSKNVRTLFLKKKKILQGSVPFESWLASKVLTVCVMSHATFEGASTLGSNQRRQGEVSSNTGSRKEKIPPDNGMQRGDHMFQVVPVVDRSFLEKL